MGVMFRIAWNVLIIKEVAKRQILRSKKKASWTLEQELADLHLATASPSVHQLRSQFEPFEPRSWRGPSALGPPLNLARA